MANKIQVRRGTAAQAAAVTLDSGELGWLTDTLRLIVGDGATAGARQVQMAGQAVACTTLDASGKIVCTDTTDATNLTTASVVLSGGLAVTKQLRVGGNVTVSAGSYVDAPTLRYGGTDILARENTWSNTQRISKGTGSNLHLQLGTNASGDASVEFSSVGSSSFNIQAYNAGVSFLPLAINPSGGAVILGTDPGGSELLRVGGAATFGDNVTIATGKTLTVDTITATASSVTFSKVINVSAGKINSGTALPASFADFAAVRTFLATAFV
jgi:hypothetical protein